LDRTGRPEVLRIEEVTYAEPGPGDVWIEHEAIGVNYLDAMQRKGTAPLTLPNGLGLGAAGRISKVGQDERNFRSEIA
jgi:NADPH2:quinone reductase